MKNLRKNLLRLPFLDDIVEVSTVLDVPVYLVGGTIRNSLLGLVSSKGQIDLDIVVGSGVKAFGKRLAKKTGGSFFLIDEIREIGRVCFKEPRLRDATVDISPMMGTCIEGDLKRRDFTLNSIAVDLNRLKTSKNAFLIDPLQGVSDVAAGSIRKNSAKVFDDDPLRLIRAIRLEAQYNLSLETDTETLLKKKSKKISAVSGERIRQEFFSCIKAGKRADFFQKVQSFGILGALLPEVEKMETLSNLSEPRLSLWESSLRAMRCGEVLLLDTAAVTGVHEKSIHRLLKREVEKPITFGDLLTFTLLFCDIGKTELMKEGLKKPPSRTGHEKKTEDTMGIFLKRIKLGKRATHVIKGLIRLQASALFFPQKKSVGPVVMYRFFKETRELGVLATLFAVALCRGRYGRCFLTTEVERRAKGLIHYFYEEFVAFQPLLTGEDLEKEVGIQPGPVYKNILKSVDDLHVGGVLRSKREALDFVRENFC